MAGLAGDENGGQHVRDPLPLLDNSQWTAGDWQPEWVASLEPEWAGLNRRHVQAFICFPPSRTSCFQAGVAACCSSLVSLFQRSAKENHKTLQNPLPPPSKPPRLFFTRFTWRLRRRRRAKDEPTSYSLLGNMLPRLRREFGALAPSTLSLAHMPPFWAS